LSVSTEIVVSTLSSKDNDVLPSTNLHHGRKKWKVGVCLPIEN